MSKYIYVAFWSLLLVLFCGCRGLAQNHECVKNFSKSFNNIDTGEVVDFKEIDCFSWDSLLVIAPAFGRKRVEKYSGVILPHEINYSWISDGEGSNWYILFIHKNKVIDYFKINRGDLDFSLLKRNVIKTGEDFFFVPKMKAAFFTYSNGVKFSNSNEIIVWAEFLE